MSNANKAIAAAAYAKPTDEQVECPKCWGKGSFNQWKHVHNGTCFTCGGTGRCSIRVAGFYFANAGR